MKGSPLSLGVCGVDEKSRQTHFRLEMNLFSPLTISSSFSSSSSSCVFLDIYFLTFLSFFLLPVYV
jgi:hypothetical protein